MNKFFLEIITPEKTFFRGEVESVNIPSIGGSCTILAGHQPMVFATEPGSLLITADGVTREAFMSEGLLKSVRMRQWLFRKRWSGRRISMNGVLRRRASVQKSNCGETVAQPSTD